MVQVVAVAARRQEFFLRDGTDAVGVRGLLRIFLAVVLHKLLLHGVGERLDGVARLALAWLLVERHAVIDLHDALRADEAETGSLARAIDEIYAQREIKGRVG